MGFLSLYKFGLVWSISCSECGEKLESDDKSDAVDRYQIHPHYNRSIRTCPACGINWEYIFISERDSNGMVIRQGDYTFEEARLE